MFLQNRLSDLQIGPRARRGIEPEGNAYLISGLLALAGSADQFWR
jgi:hypothetical protein